MHRFALLGDRDAPRRPREKLNAQRLFEDRDALADEGRRRTEFGGGGDKTRTTRSGMKQAQIRKERLIIYVSSTINSIIHNLYPI